jgi:hypothetical protein
MLKQTLIVTSAVLSTALILSGVSVAQQQVVCNPHCAPTKSNKGGEVRGLQRANDVAGEHGVQGRCNAATRQGVVLDGCGPAPGGDPAPVPVPTPVPGGGDTTGGTTGGTAPTLPGGGLPTCGTLC